MLEINSTSRLHTVSETYVHQKKKKQIRFDFLRFRIRSIHFDGERWRIPRNAYKNFRLCVQGSFMCNNVENKNFLHLSPHPQCMSPSPWGWDVLLQAPRASPLCTYITGPVCVLLLSHGAEQGDSPAAQTWSRCASGYGQRLHDHHWISDRCPP